MTKPFAKYLNLKSAPPLCRHDIESALEARRGELGAEGYAAMMRKAYARLYADGVTCRHDEEVR